MRITKAIHRPLSRTTTLLNELEFDWWGRKATVKCGSDGRGPDQIGWVDFTLDGVEVRDLADYDGVSIDEECEFFELINNETDCGLEFMLPLSDEFVVLLNRTFENHVMVEEFGIEDWKP